MPGGAGNAVIIAIEIAAAKHPEHGKRDQAMGEGKGEVINHVKAGLSGQIQNALYHRAVDAALRVLWHLCWP